MPTQPLSIVLDGPSHVAAGAPIDVRITLINTSDRPLWVVGVVDGSEVGARCPRWLPSVTSPAPVDLPELEFDMAAPLRPQDFRRLEPGEGCDPTAPEGGSAWLPLYTFVNLRPAAPGPYRLSLTLATDCGSDEEWLGSWGRPEGADAEEVASRLAGVPRVRVESNAVVVKVG